MPPSKNRFSKEAQRSTLGRIVGEHITDLRSNLNAIDFIESPQNGLGVTLYPVQRVCAKAIFGVPFDYKPQVVPVWDKFREKLLYEFTEEEYLKYVFDEGRCNIGDWRDIPEDGYKEVDLIIGRRGGKSQLISAIAAYKLYMLLSVRSPQDYYGLVPGSPIDFTFLAQDDDGSTRLYEKLREDVNRSHVFDSYKKIDTNAEMKFVTDADRLKSSWTPTITVASYPCTTNKVRGPSTYFLALDEFAFFRSETGSTSDAIYEAATPATMQFVDPNEKRDSMIISLTTPWKRIGKYYDLHKQAIEKKEKSPIFTLRCSTAEMNHRAPASFLRERFEAAPITWKAEYGGEFLDSSESYISLAQIEKCTDKGRKNLSQNISDLIGKEYFWGFDLGTKIDGSGLSIGHLEFIEGQGIFLIYDYIDRMICGEVFDGPMYGYNGADMGNRYKDFKELPIEEIIAWLVAMDRRFPCFKGGTDQHGGTMLVQLLQMNGIDKMELLHITPSLNSMMFFALKGFVDQGKAKFPDVPKFQHELQMVEAEISSKYQIRVEAPAEKGAHDDMVDATAIVAHLAQEWMEGPGRFKLDPTGQSFLMRQSAVQQSLNPSRIIDIDAVSLRDLQVAERARRMNTPSEGTVRNPYDRHTRYRNSHRRHR